MKILTLVGARPQFIKEALLSKELSRRSDLHEVLVHTGQHFDTNMSDIFFEEMGIPEPAYNLGIAGGTHASMTGKIMQEFETVLEKEKPDLVALFGDTNSTLAGALTAAKTHYPVCHVEAGARTGFLSNPEEVNRVCTDHVSAINCAPTQTCFNNLLDENLGSRSIFTGDIMFDAFKEYLSVAKESTGRCVELGNTSAELPRDFYYLTCHRQENTSREVLKEVLSAAEQLDFPAVYPVHPRMTELALSIKEELQLKNTLFIQPVGYIESIGLLEKSIMAITDSGGVQREAFFCGKKCITLLPFPSSNELLEGNRNTLVKNISQKTILEAVGIPQVVDPSYQPFGDGNAARRIVDEIEKYLANR